MKKIYFNGNIITVDKNESVVEAIVIENDKIKAVGSNDEILALEKNVEKIDLEKKQFYQDLLIPMVI